MSDTITEEECTTEDRLQMFDRILKAAASMTPEDREQWVKSNTVAISIPGGPNDGETLCCIDPFLNRSVCLITPNSVQIRAFVK